MLKKTAFLALAALALSGCASSGFSVATQANTDRLQTYQDNLLAEAETDLTAIHACYLRASGYALVPGTADVLLLQKVGEPGSAEGCTVMAGMLRTQSKMLTAFAPYLAQPLLARVPAAPEEIFKDLAEKGMGFALLKHGIDRVSAVVSNGQAAAYQIAQSAQAKHPIVMQPGVVTITPGTAESAGTASVLMPASATTVNP